MYLTLEREKMRLGIFDNSRGMLKARGTEKKQKTKKNTAHDVCMNGWQNKTIQHLPEATKGSKLSRNMFIFLA